MKISILSRGRRLYSTRRLRDAAIDRGHKVRIMPPCKGARKVPLKFADLLLLVGIPDDVHRRCRAAPTCTSQYGFEVKILTEVDAWQSFGSASASS